MFCYTVALLLFSSPCAATTVGSEARRGGPDLLSLVLRFDPAKHFRPRAKDERGAVESGRTTLEKRAGSEILALAMVCTWAPQLAGALQLPIILAARLLTVVSGPLGLGLHTQARSLLAALGVLASACTSQGRGGDWPRTAARVLTPVPHSTRDIHRMLRCYARSLRVPVPPPPTMPQCPSRNRPPLAQAMMASFCMASRTGVVAAAGLRRQPSGEGAAPTQRSAGRRDGPRVLLPTTEKLHLA